MHKFDSVQSTMGCIEKSVETRDLYPSFSEVCFVLIFIFLPRFLYSFHA